MKTTQFFRFSVFALTVLSMVLAGCGGGATQPPAAPAATQPPAAPAATKPPEAKPAEKVELVFWSMWTEKEPQAQAIQKWIDAFQKANPNITIKATWNGRQNQTKVRTALGAGTKIDFVDQDADQIAGGLVAEGQGLPLNELIKEKPLDDSGTMEDVFLPGTLHQFDVKGNTYLWPYVYNVGLLFYNMDLVQKAGANAPFATWNDLLAACEKIKGAKKACLTTEGDQAGYTIFWYTYLVARLLGPGNLLKASEDKTGEMWKNPAFLKAAQMEKELWDKGYMPAEVKGYKWPAGQQTFASGETAMELCGSWLPTELAPLAGPDFKWGASKFPAIEGGKGTVEDLHALPLSFMVVKNAPHPKEAMQFLKFVMTKENMKIMVDMGAVGVTRKGVDWPAPLKTSYEAASTAKVAFADGDGVSALHAEYWSKVLRDPHHQMFLGNVTPEQFIAKLVTDSVEYWKTHDK